jgi:hypothetical protein
MPERIVFADKRVAISMLMQHLLQGQPEGLTNGLYCDLVLTINGQPVPLVPALEGFFMEVHGNLEHLSKERAIAMLDAANLSGVASALREASVKIKLALNEAGVR